MKMNKAITGIGAAIAVTGMAAIATGAMTQPSMKKMYKKRANQAMKSMNNMMGDLQYMFK